MSRNYPDVENLATGAYVYIPFNGEAINIRAVVVEDEVFYGAGEESGQEYSIYFEDVDIKNDMFYKLTLMDYNG